MKKRKDGRYVKRVTLEDGTIKDFYGETEKEVYSKILNFDTQKEKGIKFKTAAEEWRASSEASLTYNTYECYRKPLSDVLERFGERYIKEISPHEINAYLLYLAERKLAHQTVKLRLIVLNRIFKYSIGAGYLTLNPAADISVPRTLKKSKREMPLEEDIKKAEKQPENMFQLFAYLLLYTGCRRGEALALTWDDIDFDNNLIYINKQLQFQSNKPVIENFTKSKAGIRTVPMLENLRAALLPFKKNSGYVFSVNRNLLTSKQFRDGWKSLGFSSTPHQFRHAYATTLYNAKIDAKTAQSLLGHSSVSVTLDVYTHISKNVADGAKEQLNNYISQSKFSQKS